MLTKSLCKSQVPHKSVNLSFILVIQLHRHFLQHKVETEISVKMPFDGRSVETTLDVKGVNQTST